MENPKYQDVSMRKGLWQEINKALSSYLSAQKQKKSNMGEWFHPAIIKVLVDHAEAVSKLFNLHLSDTRVPLIQTFFRGVLTLVVFSTFMPAELDAALAQSKTSDGCGIRALGCS